MKLHLEEMTRDEAHEAFEAGTVVVLPTASIEQHGPHLPLAVDTMIVTHVAHAAVARAAQESPDARLVVAPTVHYGVSHHHLAFAGTMSLTSAIYVETLKELVRCLVRHGVRGVFLLNGHGGNQNPNAVVAHALTHEEGLKIVVGQASYWTIASEALAAAGARDVAPSYPGHAGGFETSVMLALRPDLVQLDRRRPPLAPIHPIPDAQQAGAFVRAGGTSDDASRADAAAGAALVEAAVSAVAAHLARFAQAVNKTAS